MAITAVHRSTSVLVPCEGAGCGTDTASVRCAKTDRPVRLTGVGPLRLVGKRLFIELAVVARDGDLALVRGPGSVGELVWVRPSAGLSLSEE
jgi:hypothetical protein